MSIIKKSNGIHSGMLSIVRNVDIRPPREKKETKRNRNREGNSGQNSNKRMIGDDGKSQSGNLLLLLDPNSRVHRT